MGKTRKVKRIKHDADACLHVHWKHEPESHDFPAAEDYLSLVMPEPDAKAYSKKLRDMRYQLVHRKAKDILRASQLALLPIDNEHVQHGMEKTRAGDKLSPVLLIRGNYQRPLIIADGYHRVCASYHMNEDTDIPCVLI